MASTTSAFDFDPTLPSPPRTARPGRSVLGVCIALLTVGSIGCADRGPEWVRADSKTTRTLNAIHGSGPNDVWAVGEAGITTHWNGSEWQLVDSGIRTDLFDVFVLGPNEAWAVGNAQILRWDGSRWSPAPALEDLKLSYEEGGFAHEVWASSPSDVWVMVQTNSGRPKGVRRWNGTVWQKADFDNGGYFSVGMWGTDPANVWFVTGSNTLLHWDGETIEKVTPETTSRLDWFAISGTRADLIHALGTGDGAFSVLRFDGQVWSPLSNETLPPEGATDRWESIWSTGEKVWLAGNGGAVAHFDGTTWTMESYVDLQVPDLTDVWGASEADVWIVGRAGLLARRVPAP